MGPSKFKIVITQESSKSCLSISKTSIKKNFIIAILLFPITEGHRNSYNLTEISRPM